MRSSRSLRKIILIGLLAFVVVGSGGIATVLYLMAHRPPVATASAPLTYDQFVMKNGTGIAPAIASTTPSISAPPTFGSGSYITVTGQGFSPGSSLNVWFDINNNLILDQGETSVSLTVASNGSFSTQLLAQAQPGNYSIDAGPLKNATATTSVEIGTCWIQDCFITHADGSKADTICFVGNSPTDLFSFLSDCKTVDEDFTNRRGGYDFTNHGATFPGAGTLAAMTNDLVPGAGCVAIQAAMAIAAGEGETVPDGGLDLTKPTTDLTDIACGSPGLPPVFLPQPPLDLAAYAAIEAANGNSIPDVGVLFGVIGAIHTAVAAVVPVLTTAGFTGPAAEQLAIHVITAALAGRVDPATAFTIASSIGAAVSLFSGAVIASSVLLPPAILSAAQTVIAQVAVAGDIACGYVDYFCRGSDLTANILGNAALQQQEIPLSLMQPPFQGPPTPNPCRSKVGAPQLQGTCYGKIIGWAQEACTTYPDVPPGNSVPPGNVCEQPGPAGNSPQLPIPGSAGNNNSAAPNMCATGYVVGMSIGYDGDISFDVNDSPNSKVPGPGITQFINYHNFRNGPGGSDPPNGIDVEIPFPTADSSQFMPKLALIRKGVRVHVCGQWVADMHMLWNEFHPATSLSLLINATGTTLSGTEGSPLSGTVATFTDPNPSDTAAQFSATIDWGDGSTSVGSVAGGASSFTVTGGHTYAEEVSSQPIKVTITDASDSNDTAIATSTAHVADAALSASGVSFNSTNPVNEVVATFTDADPAGTTADYTASIGWGDGSAASSGTVGSSNGQFTISGSHTYGALGPHTITVHVCDIGGSCADATSQVLTFAYSAGGSFVLGNVAVGPISSAVGKSTFFWGSHWIGNNPLSGGSAPPSFKGFEDGLTIPSCGVRWTADPGRSGSAPATIPSYMAVLVASDISKHGSTITGNEVNVVIIRTSPGYGPHLNTPGTGTIVAVLC